MPVSRAKGELWMDGPVCFTSIISIMAGMLWGADMEGVDILLVLEYIILVGRPVSLCIMRCNTLTELRMDKATTEGSSYCFSRYQSVVACFDAYFLYSRRALCSNACRIISYCFR
jgi:hypothetical protein